MEKIFPSTIVLFDIFEKGCHANLEKSGAPGSWKGVVICILTCRVEMFNDITDKQRESKHSFICFYFLSKIKIQYNVSSFTGDTIFVDYSCFYGI